MTTTKFWFTVTDDATAFIAFCRSVLRDSIDTIRLEEIGTVIITHNHPAINNVFDAFIAGMAHGRKVTY